MRRAVLLAVAAPALAILLAPSNATAVCNPPCTLFCVSPEPPGPLPTSDLSICLAVYETFGEAVVAAQATGAGTETEICLLDSGAPSGTQISSQRSSTDRWATGAQISHLRSSR